MGRRILALMRKDLALAGRDQMLLFLLLAPLLLAGVLRAFLPAVQTARLTFVLDSPAAAVIGEAFGSYGRVEVVGDAAAVRERVERLDDVTGVVRDGAGYAVIAEGNEAGELAELTEYVLYRVIAGPGSVAGVEIERISRPVARDTLRGFTTSLLALMAVLMAGVFVGFVMIGEKENSTLGALAVSPLTLGEFIAARAVTVVGLGLTGGIAGSLVLYGGQADYARVAVGILSTTLLGLAVGLVIGGLAADQISGTALVKVLMIFLSGVPIAQRYVPAAWRVALYPFPNYWAFLAFENVFSGPQAFGFWLCCALAVTVSAVLLGALLPMLRRRWNLR